MVSAFLVAAALFSAVVQPGASVVRSDFTVSSDPGIELFVRQVRTAGDAAPHDPVLLIHGARVGGLASFDVDVNGLSLAAHLARAGHAVYIADLRGFGRSTYPEAMHGPRFEAPPATPTGDAVTDIRAVLAAIKARHGQAPVAGLGWATGSHRLAAAEAAYPGSFDRLVVFNAVYGGQGDWPLSEAFSAPGEPGRFDYDRFGAYRLSDADSLVGRWARADGVSEAFVARYVELAMEGDPTAQSRTPTSFRHPSGPIADTLRAVHDGALYDAGDIRSRVLILRSEDDFWSRPIDVTTLADDLNSAADVTVAELSGASHYVHLQPGQARERFLTMVLDYLQDGRLDEVVVTE